MAAVTSIPNSEIADVLERVASLLDIKKENTFKIQAYRQAAETVRYWPDSLAEILHSRGEEALEDLPGIGKGLAGAIAELVNTGHLAQLERLSAEAGPTEAFAQLPLIGPELARRIHDQLGIHSLEDLERAAHDGRLGTIEGFGPGRIQGIKDALAGKLSRAATRKARERSEQKPPREHGAPSEPPPVDALLDLDAEYRRRAAAGELKTIAPHRFNPEGKDWLPVLNASRQGWHFTVLYSNTARAHELEATHDWVVIYYERGNAEDQCTIVTAQRGTLAGKRVIRGREAECREYYASRQKE